MIKLRTLSSTALLTATVVTGTALAGLATPAGAAGTGAQPRERYDVAIKVSDHEPELGDRVTVKGFVDPAAPGQRVRLQVKYAGQGQWKTVDTDKLSNGSRYRFSEKVKTVRERTYRVVKPAAGTSGRAASQREKVTVFAWRDLADLPAAASSGIYPTTGVSINAVSFPDALLQSVAPASDTTTRSVDYNLNRDCTTLVGTAGLADSSPVGGAATVGLSTDGVSKFSQSFGLTQSAPVSIDLTGVFRLTMTSTPAGGGQGVLGSPQVYCSF